MIESSAAKFPDKPMIVAGDRSFIHAEAMRSAPVDGIRVGENEPSEILYTSGTTGKPKGCVHIHRTIGNCALISIATFHFSPAERTLIAMRIWHTAPLNNFTIPTPAVGGTLVLLPRYHPEHFIRTLVA